MAFWRTPDAAIQAAKQGPSVGIDYAKVAGDRYQAELYRDACSAVLAALGQLPKREQQIVEAYACTGLGYRQIAKQAGLSPSHTQRIHRRARDQVARRLVQLGLLDA